MLRSILVGLDGSRSSQAALELAIRWTKRFDALLVGLGVVDEPGLHGSEEALVGKAFFAELNTSLVAESRRLVERSLGQFSIRCAKAGIAFKELENIGTPYVQILMESQRYDVIMLGQQTHFEFGWSDESDETLAKVLAESPRPVVAVPDQLGSGESVVIAYDGSLQAARALSAFVAAGLGQDRDVAVVSVDREHKEAARRADRAIDYLHAHEVRAVPHVIATPSAPVQVVLEWARKPETGLVVMGAYGQPILREFFLGSVTRTLLKESPVPMFLFH